MAIQISTLYESHFVFTKSHAWPGGGNGNPVQYSCLGNPMDGGAWWVVVHGVTKSQTQLSDFTFTFHFHALEKEKATHSSVLGWRIPGTGEPGGLLSMGSHRVGHDWSDLAAAAAIRVWCTTSQSILLWKQWKNLLQLYITRRYTTYLFLYFEKLRFLCFGYQEVQSHFC